MRPLVPTHAFPQRRFRRAPSRCQIVWQGILVLATLALAFAANAQSTCFELFGSTNAPLKLGSTVTIHYSFSRADANVLANAATKVEVQSSAARESHRLFLESQRLQMELAKQSQKRDSTASLRKTSEISTRLTKTKFELKRAMQIDQLAQSNRPLEPEELALLTSHVFEQTVSVNTKADERLLMQRLAALDGHLATYDPIKYPRGKIAKIFRLAKKHYIATFVLVSMSMGLAQQGYDLYAASQAQMQNGSVVQVYESGLGDTPIKPANQASEPIGN